MPRRRASRPDASRWGQGHPSSGSQERADPDQEVSRFPLPCLQSTGPAGALRSLRLLRERLPPCSRRVEGGGSDRVVPDRQLPAPLGGEWRTRVGLGWGGVEYRSHGACLPGDLVCQLPHRGSPRSRDPIAAAHQQITIEWWSRRRADFDLVVSQVVIDEIQMGDPTYAKSRLEVVASLPRLLVTSSYNLGPRHPFQRISTAEGLPGCTPYCDRHSSPG
jgi:hypothetical protein